MTSTAISNVREQVVSAAGRYARQYPRVVDGVVSAISEAGSVQAGKDYLRNTGYGAYAYLLDSVTVDSVAQSEEEVILDAAVVCEVIRAFITEGSPHLGRSGRGATPEQVTALLQIAGLEDVPEPEPVTVESGEGVEVGVLHRLVNWAKGIGFSG